MRLLASVRTSDGESYVAGGAALNTILQAPRLSRDVDLFHDAPDAVRRSYEKDRAALAEHGLKIQVLVDRDAYVEAIVLGDGENCLVQWTQDSAFRFFPLVTHSQLGLTLHPFDHATNKVLALVGRAEPRDWIDTITCSEELQPFGYLAWAAAGKDPGLNPMLIVEEAERARYTEQELAFVEFAGPRPSAADLAQKWKRIVSSARQVVSLLPAAECGKCVLDSTVELARFEPEALKAALAEGALTFHSGSLRGAFPKIT